MCELIGSVGVQLIAKAFPPAQFITQVIKTAKAYWKEHPKNFIGIHCAYGAIPDLFLPQEPPYSHFMALC